MKYSNKLNLGEILKHAPEHLIMRRSGSFPNYYRGQDVDILCIDIQAMMDHIKPFLPNFTVYPISQTHIQLDHWDNGLDIKFDFYSRHISNRLTEEALSTKVELLSIQAGQEAQKFFVPTGEMENILKCYEWLRNKKAKYISYAKYEHLLKSYEI